MGRPAQRSQERHSVYNCQRSRLGGEGAGAHTHRAVAAFSPQPAAKATRSCVSAKRRTPPTISLAVSVAEITLESPTVCRVSAQGNQMIRLATLTLLLVPVTLHAELIVGSALTIVDPALRWAT